MTKKTDLEQLTAHFGMRIISRRGKHRSPGGDYVYGASGSLHRLDDESLIHSAHCYGDDAQEADDNVRTQLLAFAEAEELKLRAPDKNKD
ncbi:hypothetical protein F0U60_18590 [Archangium minus]|uniref:Uncharacterized protein n=1 Tax=Archangium minus TaxID=83450 RepID=A0ABY9WSW7_9BACT|nr:hypothetical protein F0U60_18590 [Archangium minus]